MGVVYILIDMKTNDPLGDLIDNLIDVYVDNKTPKGVTKQLEPIINGLVELLQGEAQGSPIVGYEDVNGDVLYRTIHQSHGKG